jgi:hypothetical protein
VDGGPSWVAAARPDVVLVTLAANAGYPAAVNRGFAEARRLAADAVLLVNDDAVFAPGSVGALSERLLADPSAAAVSAKMVYRDRPGILNGTGGIWCPTRGWAALRGAGEPDDGRYHDRPFVDYPSGAASLLRMTAVERVGPLDVRFFLYFEDADWGLRASALGWRTRYEPSALVTHVGSAGTAALPERRRYYNVRNRLLLAALHAPPRGKARAWLETAALAARQPARWPWPHRRVDAEAVALGIADHLRGRYGRSARFG